MKYYAYLFSLIVLVVTACATSKNNHEVVEVEQPAQVEEDLATKPSSEEEEQKDSVTIAQVAQDDSLFAFISRGACYGTCPTYKMYIYNDGTVLLDGIRFMKPLGKYHASIDKAEMDKFVTKAKEIEYFSLKDVYDGRITDIPGTLTSIVIDGKRKQVYRRYNYPQRILRFEELFDNLLTTLNWEADTED
jgi:hypothetical protein